MAKRLYPGDLAMLDRYPAGGSKRIVVRVLLAAVVLCLGAHSHAEMIRGTFSGHVAALTGTGVAGEPLFIEMNPPCVGCVYPSIGRRFRGSFAYETTDSGFFSSSGTVNEGTSFPRSYLEYVIRIEGVDIPAPGHMDVTGAVFRFFDVGILNQRPIHPLFVFSGGPDHGLALQLTPSTDVFPQDGFIVRPWTENDFRTRTLFVTTGTGGFVGELDRVRFSVDSPAALVALGIGLLALVRRRAIYPRLLAPRQHH